MNKLELELMYRRAKLVPVARANIRGYEVFIADGFLTPDDLKHRRRFDLDTTLFPWGAYETSWFTARGEDKLHYGHVFWCDAFHDTGLSKEDKLRARIAQAERDADDFLRSLHARH